MLCRIFIGQLTPIRSKEDPVIINSLNNITSTSIEQGLVFYITVIYNDLIQATKENFINLYSISFVFLFGRIIYAIGGVLGE